MEIIINQPFDLGATLECGQGHRWRKEQGSDAWHETVVGDSKVRIRQKGDVRRDVNVVELLSPWTDAEAEAFLRCHFRLDDPIEKIYALLSDRDPIMSKLVNCYRGLRVMRIAPWECLAFFILSVRSPISRAQDNLERLSNPLDSTQRRALPDADNLAATDVGVLKQRLVGFSDYGPRLRLAAKAVSSGFIDFEALREMPYPQIIKKLRGLKGVGPKVANCVALFSLDKLEAFPIDTHIHKGLKRLYGHALGLPSAKSPEAASLRHWVHERFGSYGGYASQFLFIDQYRSARPQASG